MTMTNYLSFAAINLVVLLVSSVLILEIGYALLKRFLPHNHLATLTLQEIMFEWLGRVNKDGLKGLLQVWALLPLWIFWEIPKRVLLLWRYKSEYKSKYKDNKHYDDIGKEGVELTFYDLYFEVACTIGKGNIRESEHLMGIYTFLQKEGAPFPQSISKLNIDNIEDRYKFIRHLERKNKHIEFSIVEYLHGFDTSIQDFYTHLDKE